MIVTTILAILFTAGCTNCQMINNECNKAMNDFNDSESLGDVCKASYESIVGPRDPNCTGQRYTLCEGICLQPAKTISCNCHEGSMIIDNIGRICGCADNISCPFPLDNCSKTVDTFQYNEKCGAAYSSLVANGTCTSCCQSLCSETECMMLLRNVSCQCSKMTEGNQIIKNISAMCECSIQDCRPSGIGISLMSPWIIISAVAMVTWWI